MFKGDGAPPIQPPLVADDAYKYNRQAISLLFVGMKRIISSFEHIFMVSHFVKWTLIIIPLAVVVGTEIAFFLLLLDGVTHFRWLHIWLAFLLPVAGIVIHFLDKISGKKKLRQTISISIPTCLIAATLDAFLIKLL